MAPDPSEVVCGILVANSKSHIIHNNLLNQPAQIDLQIFKQMQNICKLPNSI
jgi:hypothetical protein